MKRRKRIICTLLVLLTMLSSSILINAASWPVIKKGDRGADVTALQYLLKSKGYSITVDGDFGSRTEGNVKNFQSARGLTRDGIVGAATWSKLIVTLQLGAKSNAVKALQYELKHVHNFNYITVDGNFGPNTETAVKDFQLSKGLARDGIVGEKTWMYIIGD